MNKQKILETATDTVIATLVVLALLWITGLLGPVKAPLKGVIGNRAGNASTTLYALTASTIQAMSTTTCEFRVVTTGSSAVALSFFDQPLDATHLGKYQAASTTTSYDAGTYGCGGMKARSAAGAVQLEVTDIN